MIYRHFWIISLTILTVVIYKCSQRYSRIISSPASSKRPSLKTSSRSISSRTCQKWSCSWATTTDNSNPSSSNTTSTPSESHLPSSTGKQQGISSKEEEKGLFSIWSSRLLRKEHWTKMDNNLWWNWWRFIPIHGNALWYFRWSQKSSARELRIWMITIGSYQALFNSQHQSSRVISLSRTKRLNRTKTGSKRIWSY